MADYRTDFMDEILTSPEARNIVGQVSPIYGASFAGLWLFQVIGRQLDDMEAWSRAFQAETVPQTATWSLDYWEENYGIPRNPYLSEQQRRARIISRIRDRAPMSPAKLSKYIADVTGYECEIIENTGKNQFTLSRLDQSGPLGLVRILLNEAKPAHLIYKLNSVWQNAVTTREFAAAALSVLARLKARPEARLNRIEIKGPVFRTRESAAVGHLWSMGRQTEETAAARLNLCGAVQTGELAALRSVQLKIAARQSYGAAAYLITSKDFAFDGGFAFDGKKKFNANAATPL